jgi:hypothetical protein
LWPVGRKEEVEVFANLDREAAHFGNDGFQSRRFHEWADNRVAVALRAHHEGGPHGGMPGELGERFVHREALLVGQTVAGVEGLANLHRSEVP